MQRSSPAPTEVDDDSLAIEHAEATVDDDVIDALLELAVNTQDDDSQMPCESDDSQLTANENDESDDSQLTANEHDEHDRNREHIQDHTFHAHEHWSETIAFKDGVRALLNMCKDHHWFSREILDDMNLKDYDACVQKAISFIQVGMGTWLKFKIGITENPFLRWNASFGYRFKSDMDVMFLIYAAPTSKHQYNKYDSEAMAALKKISTGTLEKHLVSIFSSEPTCVNREGSGGDCPSAGSPHFLYVASKLPDVFDFDF